MSNGTVGCDRQFSSHRHVRYIKWTSSRYLRQEFPQLKRRLPNQRRDFHHKQASKLVKKHQVIAFEELQLTNLVRSPKAKQNENGMYPLNGAAAKGGLNKSMLDAGWGQFVQIVTSKAACAGRVVAKINPKKTSQICSACGKRDQGVEAPGF
jgi:putative transposase